MKVRGIQRVEIRYEHDVVLARQRARQIAELLGFENQDQARIATSVSEIARNAFQYAGGGSIDFQLRDGAPQRFVVVVQDRGPGFGNLKSVLDGTYVSPTGMGVGVTGARRLMDSFQVESVPGQGATVRMEKCLPLRQWPVSPADLAKIAEVLTVAVPNNPYSELRAQNREVLKAMSELREKQLELAELNAELENTNRGVLALYAELDEKAESLRRASEAKTAFLSDMTHEFRTPLNSILNISNFLIDPVEGLSNPEHLTQVQFIRKSAQDLSDLVNDLLDLAKVEAGKIQVRPEEVRLGELFGVMRGLMKPLLRDDGRVSLTFADPDAFPPLRTDPGKISQILRNFISNALKYTSAGEVRVSAELVGEDRLRISVADTGMGIAPEDQERIFEEFVQIDSPLQRRHKGSGLGLALTRRLTKLLGGEIELRSELGVGSTFSVVLPRIYAGPEEGNYLASSLTMEAPIIVPSAPSSAQEHRLVLIVDDDAFVRQVLGRVMTDLGFGVVEASDGQRGLELAREEKPDLIFLDLVMPVRTGAEMLAELSLDERTRRIPVVIHSSRDLGDPEYNQIGTYPALAYLPKLGMPRAQLFERVRELLAKHHLIPGLQLELKESSRV